MSGVWAIQTGDVLELLGEQIGYHVSRDLDENWTKDYTEGYVDGLKGARDVILELAYRKENEQYA